MAGHHWAWDEDAEGDVSYWEILHCHLRNSLRDLFWIRRGSNLLSFYLRVEEWTGGAESLRNSWDRTFLEGKDNPWEEEGEEDHYWEAVPPVQEAAGPIPREDKDNDHAVVVAAAAAGDVLPRATGTEEGADPNIPEAEDTDNTAEDPKATPPEASCKDRARTARDILPSAARRRTNRALHPLSR